ncbi:hypothetical protein JCM11251_004477 [Rhodosporidiobolus azoricus]
MEGDQDFTTLPIPDRLSHKVWKARLSAYTQIIADAEKTLDEDDALFREHWVSGSSIREWVRDANAVAQEKGVEAACKAVEFGGKALARSRADVVPSIVEKCLGSTRAGTRSKAIELCLLYVEVEEDKGEGVIGDILPGLDAKQPKVVAGSVSVLKEIVRCFGPPTISVPPILRCLPKIFAHADKTVRSEGQLLALSLHSYLGAALTPHLSELKPVQQKELGEVFEQADSGEKEEFGFGRLKPSRFTVTQKKERARKEAEGQLNGAGEAGEEGRAEEGEEGGGEDVQSDATPPDPYDFATPLAVLSNLPAEFYSNLSSSKWKDRKELALEPLLVTLSSSPRYESDNYADLVGALAGRMGDANVLCVVLAAQCLEKLAKGLRGEFARYKQVVTPAVLARTKEKKVNVLEALGAALDATFASTSISDFTEDILTFSKDKNPSVKASTLSFYTRCLSSTLTPPSKADLPPLIEAFKKTLEDSDAAVRAAAADVLGTLSKVVGERVFGTLVGEMDPLRMGKVKEAEEKALVKCKGGLAAGGGSGGKPAPKAGPPAAVAKGKPAPARRPPVEKENAPPSRPSPAASPVLDDDGFAPLSAPSGPPKRGPPARLATKKPPPASAAPPATAKKPPPSSAAVRPTAPASTSSAPSAPLRPKYTQESAESIVESGDSIPPEIVALLSDSNWKQRLEGMEKLEEWAKLDGREKDAEVVVRWVVGKKPGPKESNFQVSAKLFSLLSQLASDSPTWTKACSAAAIPLLCDKLGDIKLKKPAADALGMFAEKSSAGFVLSQAYEPMSKQKAVKTLAESFLFVDQLLRDFGLAGGLAVRDLIEFLKVGLKHSNAQVRTNATKTLVTLRLFVGPEITSFLSDLTPQLLSTIDSEFDKVSSEPAPSPTRIGADTAGPPAPSASTSAPSGGAGKGGKGAAPEVDPLDELFPRVDFDRLVSSAQAQACGDANWKVRKEALEGIRDLLEANKRIKPTAMPELANPLKQRITDSNKIIQILALDIVAHLAAAMGRPFGEKLSRVFASAVTTTLADQKANIRAAGVTTLSAMADASGLDGLVGAFDKPLEGNNSVQRKELLGWLEGRFKDDEEASVGIDLAPLAPGLLSCLEDRNTDVRKSATAILPTLVARVGYGTVMDAVAKLKPASKSTVLPLVEAARSAASNLGSAAPAHAAPAAAPPARPATARPAPPAAAKPAASAAASSAAPSLASSATSSRPTSGLSRPAAKPLRTAAPTPLEEPAGPSALPSRLAAPRSRPSIGGLRTAAAASRPAAPPSSAPPSPCLGVKEAPFRSADPTPKLLRHKKETGSMRWVVEGTPRSDQVDWLAQQMAPQVSAALHAQLFSTDHSAERDFLAGLTVIDEVAKDPLSAETAYDVAEEEMRERLIANLDLIFKYITLRIGMTSTTITVKCLDVVEHLIPVLSQASYKTSDYEATPLLLSLINKVGDSKELIRQRVRGIFKAICSVYPFSKVFSTILEHGLDNKNARVRSECVEELGQLYARHGVSVHPISQALPKIAAFIGKPDATTRTAALHAIGAVYTLVGADVTWKAVGNLPPKDRSMLEERLKRTATGAASPAPAVRMASTATPVARPGTPSGLRPPAQLAAPSSPSPAPTSNGLGQPRGLPRPAAGIPSRLQRPQSVAAGGHGEPSGGIPAPRSGLSAPGFASKLAAPSSSRLPSAHSAPTASLFTEDDLMAETASDLPSLIDALDTDDPTTSADVLKLITREITKNSEDVHHHADQLIDALTARMELGFTDLSADTPPAQLRLCKHLMQTLSAFFDKRALSQQVSRLPLTALLADLTGRLLDTADNPASEPIQSLSKVLNMVLIRIFHNSDQNVCFGALLTVLQDATIDLRELRQEDLTDRAKYAELVMKCLWKVSKTVKESLESRQLVASRLLTDINSFLVAIPPGEWRRRAADSIPLVDLPLRTVKTILQQIVSIYKETVFEELHEIDGAENSFVYQYLYRLVAQPGSDSKTTGMSAPSLTRQASTSSLGSAKTRHSTSPPRSNILSRNGSNGSGASSVAAAPIAPTPAPAPPSTDSSPGGSDITINQRLKEIFDLIGDPNNSRAGIAELYEFQKEHPEAVKKVETWMAGTGSYFQTYLKRALANLKAADPDAKDEPPTSPSLDAFGRPSSRMSRPSSAAPGTPTRASRASIGSGTGFGMSSTPQNSAKLQELQSMFGFAQKE